MRHESIEYDTKYIEQWSSENEFDMYKHNRIFLGYKFTTRKLHQVNNIYFQQACIVKLEPLMDRAYKSSPSVDHA